MKEERKAPPVEEGEARSKTLKERAVALAKKPESEAVKQLEILEFILAGGSYGVEVSALGQVHPAKGLMPIPCTPPRIAGAINVRGTIIPIIDSRALLGLAPRKPEESDTVIVLRGTGREFGILVDDIVGTRSLPLAAIRQPLPTMASPHPSYIKGMTDDRLALLDAERMLADEELVVQEEVDSTFGGSS